MVSLCMSYLVVGERRGQVEQQRGAARRRDGAPRQRVRRELVALLLRQRGRLLLLLVCPDQRQHMPSSSVRVTTTSNCTAAWCNTVQCTLVQAAVNMSSGDLVCAEINFCINYFTSAQSSLDLRAVACTHCVFQ